MYQEIKKNLVTEKEKSPVREKVLSTLSGFDTYLRQYKKENIVDMYTIGPVNPSPIEESEAIAKLSECLGDMKSLGLDRLPEEWASTYESIAGIIRYRQQNEHPSDRPLLLREIGGVESKRFSIESLKQRRQKFINLLEEMTNSKVGTDEESLREVYTKYQGANQVIGTDLATIIQQEIQNHARRQFQAIQKTTGIDFSPLYDETDANFVKVVVDNIDAPWTMWSMRGPDLKREVHVNAHARQIKMLDRGSLEGYTWHEDVMHQGSNYAQALEIQAGRLDPIAGYLLIPSPLHLKEEAIAMRANHFIDGFSLSPSALLFQENYGLYVIARANSLHDMAEESLSLEEAAEKYKSFVFLKPYEHFIRDLENGRENPFWTPYFEQYRRGEEAIMTYIQETKSDLPNEECIKTLLTRPMTPSQMEKLLRLEV